MIRDVSDDKFTIFEIYPNIYVYKNLFKNIDEVYSILKQSHDTPDQNLFSEWSQWSIFGDYLNPVVPNTYGHSSFSHNRYLGIDTIEVDSILKQKQKDFLIELFDGFYNATEDYIIKHNISIDESVFVKGEDGFNLPLWRMTGPTICKYHISDEANRVGMRYHTDYMPEQSNRPGYKFVITGLAYFNDDYIGGELDFCIGKKLVKYKPQAGDYIVFPSGHPDFLTEDGMVYLHGVMPAEGAHKYFSRMYWQKYYEGSMSWFEKEKEYGRETWLSMQDDLDKQYRDMHPQRSEIEGGIRIQ